MSNAKNWPCAHAKCTREKPFCLDLLGEEPTGEMTFMSLPGDDKQYCSHVAKAFTDRFRADSQSATGYEDALSEQEELLPATITARLQEYIAGQDVAMKRMGTFLYRETILKPRLRENGELLEQHQLDAEDVKKSTALLFGSTGAGKTLTAELAKRLFDMPISIYSGIKNVSSGAWVGTKIESVFAQLVTDVVNFYAKKGKKMKAADAVKGINNGTITPIFYLDEIDKIAIGDRNNTTGKDVGGEDLQSMLLTYIEDAIVELGQAGSLRTRNIVFVLMGAFSTPNARGKTLAQEINPDTGGNAQFDVNDELSNDQLNDIYARAESKHFTGWFIDQFIGRIGYWVPFMTLGHETLRAILSEYKGNPVSAMMAEIEMLGGRLVFSSEALDLIAEEAYSNKTGARALVKALERVLGNVMHEAPSRIPEGQDEVYISAEMVKLNGTIIEEGENATFRKARLIEVETTEVEMEDADDADAESVDTDEADAEDADFDDADFDDADFDDADDDDPDNE